jgi:hypothetical protein
MSIWRLVLREIAADRTGFLVGALAMLLAAACLTTQATVLRRHELRTRAALHERLAEAEGRMRALEMQGRADMRHLGFTLRILPEAQVLGDLFAEGYASKTMPEAYADRLAGARLFTLAYLSPVLEGRATWPEYGRMMVAKGTRGVTAMADAGAAPDVVVVEPGTLAVGYELARGLGMRAGMSVRLAGRPYRVARCLPERGSRDDITVWMPLAEAQALLGKPGQLTAIEASGREDVPARLSTIRAEVARALPGTQVIELGAQALTRAETAQRARADIVRARTFEEEQARLRLAGERRFGLLLVGAAGGVGLALVALLMLANVRARRMEIGALRALGARTSQVAALFVGKALALGLAGAIPGYLAGLALAAAIEPGAALFSLTILLAAVPGVVSLAGVAGLWPALRAAREDPAAVLAGE